MPKIDLTAATRNLDRADPEITKKIPQETLGEIRRYVLQGCPMGHFLTACFTNNLYEAVGRGDLENQRALVPIVQYIHSYCPAISFGNLPMVNDYIRKIRENK